MFVIAVTWVLACAANVRLSAIESPDGRSASDSDLISLGRTHDEPSVLLVRRFVENLAVLAGDFLPAMEECQSDSP